MNYNHQTKKEGTKVKTNKRMGVTKKIKVKKKE
jgi:hypothetical protein